MRAVTNLVTLALAAGWVIVPRVSAQQKLDLAKVVERLEADGRVSVDEGRVQILRYDYAFDGDEVEAIAFRPSADGRYPGVLLIPGFSRTARDYIPMGIRFAKEGFACVAVTQRGFGKSRGAADFVGPKTVAALEAGLHKFSAEPYVDGSRLGILGYSRGAMAASLLAVRAKQADLKAAVFAAGVYDFKKAYDDIKLAGIRANMEHESGLSETAVKERTSLTKMGDLNCPVLILHGEKDENAPVNQAYMLRDRLKELNKEFELKVFPDAGHDIGRQNLYDHALGFLKRKLAGAR
jgi:dipeptidyl aminopeptidase/acylaminoacyl peptidase